jgi:hypothetical protein
MPNIINIQKFDESAIFVDEMMVLFDEGEVLFDESPSCFLQAPPVSSPRGRAKCFVVGGRDAGYGYRVISTTVGGEISDYAFSLFQLRPFGKLRVTHNLVHRFSQINTDFFESLRLLWFLTLSG